MNKIATLFIRHTTIIIGMLVCGSYQTTYTNTKLQVITFNVTQNSQSTEEHHPWNQRREPIIDFLKKQSPDIIALQSLTLEQVNDIVSALNDEYHYIEGSRGTSWWGMGCDEQCLILWDKEKFELETKGSSIINQHNKITLPIAFHKEGFVPRVVLWARLRVKETGETINVFNTHFDTMFQAACMEGLRRTLALTSTQSGPQDINIIMGTFNISLIQDECLKILESHNCSDLRYEANTQQGPVPTASYWGEENPAVVDYVLLQTQDKRRIQVLTHTVFEEDRPENAPSRHRPISAQIEIVNNTPSN